MHGTGAGADPEAGGCAATSPETCWASTAMPYLLLNWLKDPLPLSGIVERLAAPPNAQGGGSSALLREVRAAVLVGPCLDRTHALCLRPRVHRFLRGLRCVLCARAFSGTCCSAGFRSSGHKLASDCIVNGYMLGVGCSEIAALRPCQVPIPAEIPRYVLATVYLRCELLGCADEIRPMLICAG